MPRLTNRPHLSYDGPSEKLTESASYVYNGVMTCSRGKELDAVTFEEAKRIHRREVQRVGQGLTYRGKNAKAMGEEYLDEVIEAEEVLADAWDPTTMSWRKPTDENSADLPT